MSTVFFFVCTVYNLLSILEKSKTKKMRQLVVATHNLMNGRRLGGLLQVYRQALPKLKVQILCLQENIDLEHFRCDSDHCGRRKWHGGPDAGGVIAAALGRSWRRSELRAKDPRLVTLFDEHNFDLITQDIVTLPRLGALNWLERTYISAGEPEQKHALFSLFRSTRRVSGGSYYRSKKKKFVPERKRIKHRARVRIIVANTHLDAAGTNQHRTNQMNAVASSLSTWARKHIRPQHRRLAVFLVAADTNCFEISRQSQRNALHRIMLPLNLAIGALDLHDYSNPDTHWFARTDEPGLGHKIVSFLGRLGIDAPRRYDVLASNVPALAMGTIAAVDSDHDVVWASLCTSRSDWRFT